MKPVDMGYHLGDVDDPEDHEEFKKGKEAFGNFVKKHVTYRKPRFKSIFDKF